MTGRVLANRYELGDVVGQGGMAVVYRAHDRTLGRDVAIKVLHEQYAADPEFVERFEREARAAARLSHPHVVDIYDVGSDGSTRFIVMELVDGQSLKDLVQRGGAVPPALVIRFGREIASALEFAHRRGFVHRDVKPQNVLVDQDGHARLSDFGIAQAVENVALTQTGTVLGTPQYMAPEQARGQPTGPTSDIYSLGVVLYELATGQVPFTADSPLAVALRHIQDEPLPPRRLNPSLPPALERAILRALAKEPGQRQSSAAMLAEELGHGPDPVRERTTPVSAVPAGATRRAAAAAPAGVRRAPPAGRRPVAPARPRKSNAGPIVLLLLLVVSLGALAFGFNFLFRSRPGPALALATPSPSPAAQKPAVAPTSMPTATRPPATATPAPTTAPTATPAPPTPTPPPPTVARVAVPRLVGLSLAAAQAQVSSRGLALVFDFRTDPRQADGIVLEQSPKEGEAVAPRTVVNLVVNRLATVAVPNVGGMEEAEARKTLEKDGLKVAVDKASGGRKGVVNDQSPQPGVRVAPGTEVKIVIGS